jgi:amino acid adenylation domain-containing protein
MATNINQSSEFYFTSQQKNKERDYWLNKLSGIPNRVFFPYHRNISGKSQVETKSFPFSMHRELSGLLVKLSNSSDLRLHILFVTAVSFLLVKYTGNRDITLGMPIYKQELKGSEEELINTILAIRNRVEPGMTVKTFILQVSQAIFEAVEHQNYPIKVLVNQLDIPPSDSYFPLFDIAVLLENIQRPSDIRSIPLNMIFSFKRIEKDIRGEVEYNASLYQESQVSQVIDHLIRFMERAFSAIESPLDEIDILAAEEKERLLDNLNRAAVGYPLETPIHRLFERQEQQGPDQIAVLAADHELLTYRQLNEKANRLARWLREKGIREDTIVGIMNERTVDMVVGMMAVLKAGGAYLSIAPGNPPDRHKFILDDSGAVVLLTQQTLYEKNGQIVAEFPSEQIFLFEDQRIYKKETTNLEIDGKSSQVAYVIYTSGTTGRPKGVMVSHKSLINFSYSLFHFFNQDFSRVDNCLSLTDITFDVSVCELFVPLFFGSTLVLLRGEKLFDPSELAAEIIEKVVTFAYIPPGLLKGVSDNLREYGPALVLNKLLVGVEPINDYVLDEYRKLKPDMQIINGYGPTEATICATFYRFNRHTCRGMNVPIGEPLPNTGVVFLDPQQKLYPYGVPGELFIFGQGLARGYLNHPELTSRKFIKNKQFLRGPGEESKKTPGCQELRLYSTGDIGRWLEDGNIEFLGRIDSQLKIRGNRIEPGEIENQLLMHEQVKQSVVVERNSSSMERYLCAYVVYRSSPGPSASQLVNFLSRVLPAFMIPQYFVPLERIPLTPHGKVDKEALPDPVLNSMAQYVAPATENEKIIANLWKEILKVDQVGINDNFFEIGGNSLSIVKLKALLEKKFGKEVPDVKLLEYPTILSFSNYLNREIADTDSSPSEAMDQHEIEDKSVNKLRMRRQVLDEDSDYEQDT